MKHSLSIIIITKNSAETIEKCLTSVQWANEIIILDSGSTDETVSICRKYTNHVIETDWPGFGPQKNRALEKATGDWVFSIDSDEWVTDELRNEITQTLQHATKNIFILPRRNQYCGKWICHGDVGKDSVIRLFKRGTARFSDDIVHEKLLTDQQPLGKLKSPLMHNSYASVDALIQRFNHYTTLSGQTRFTRGKKTSLTRAIFAGFWAFLRSYFFRFGILDGKMGFIVAISSAESSYYRHVKLLELQKGLV